MSGPDDRDRWHEDPDEGEDEEDPRPRRRVFDLTSDGPVVTEVDPDFPFTTHVSNQVRVFVAQGNRRTCAIPIILLLLTLCCACLGFWVLADNLF